MSVDISKHFEKLKVILNQWNLKLMVQFCCKSLYYMAELVQGEKEQSDWFPEGSVFCYTDR